VSDTDDILTVEEAAALLKVDPATVQRELRAGRLPGNKVGRAWRIHREDLRVYLKGQQLDPQHAIEQAHMCLHQSDVDGALVSLVGGLGYEPMPPELRFALTRRAALLIEARDATDPEVAETLAEKARWNPEGDDAFSITYVPTVPGFSPPWRVKLPDAWNAMVYEFGFALHSYRRMVAAGAAGKVVLHWTTAPPTNRHEWETVARAFLEERERAPGVFDVHLTQAGARWKVRVVHSPVKITGHSDEPLDYSDRVVKRFVAAGLPAFL
jgi:excisionase family DNA binding protein